MIQDPILIVDDEAEVRMTLLEALEHRGYSAEAVPNAEAALVRMGQRNFPVVITDFHMPGGQSGLELISVIRHRYPDTLCVLITAFASVETSVAALKHGAYDLIQKPFRLADMEVVLNRALDHASLLQKLRAYHGELEDRVLSRTRDLAEAQREALELCDLSLQALDRPTMAEALDALLDRLAARWSPSGLACYRHDGDGYLFRLASRGKRPLPDQLERPQPGLLPKPGLGFPEEHLVPLGNAGWLYLGFEGRSTFNELDPGFRLLARHLELLLRVR